MTAAELLVTTVTLLGHGQLDAERLRGLAEWLGTAAWDVDGIDEAKRGAWRLPQAVLLAGGPGSPALGLRCFPPGIPTAVHGHGSWGVATVLEEDTPSTRRLSGWRATTTEDGLVAENEARVTDTASEEERMWREIHLLHLAGKTIAEHTLYCTGVWDRATMARRAAEALIPG